MKKFLILIGLFMFINVSSLSSQKPKSPKPKPCGCVKWDKKGNCKVADYSGCPEVITGNTKRFNVVYNKKTIFKNEKTGELNKDWMVVGQDDSNSSIVLVNSKKATTGSINCNACCHLVVQDRMVWCATGKDCESCNMIVVSPSPQPKLKAIGSFGLNKG